MASIIVYHTQARRFSGRFPVAARTENHCPHCKPQAKGKQVLSGNQNWESLPSLQTEAKGKQRPENILVCCRPGFLGWKCQQVTRLPEVVGGLNDTFFFRKMKRLDYEISFGIMNEIFWDEFGPGERASEGNSLHTRRDGVSHVEAACQRNAYKQAITRPGWGWSWVLLPLEFVCLQNKL